jgi:hypothetical protein
LSLLSSNRQTTGFFKDKATLITLILLLLSFAFRVYFLPLARFAGDEAFFFKTAKDVVELKYFPVHGSFVTGSEARVPGGLYHLLMAIPVLFYPDPIAPMLVTCILNVLALFLLFVLIRRHYSSEVALLTLIFALFNPFSVLLGDRQWNPDLLIPIGTLWLFLLTKIFEGDTKWSSFFLFFLLVVSMQIHLSVAHLWVVTFFYFLFWRQGRPNVKFSLIGAFVGLAFYIPYLVHEMNHGFQNTRNLLFQVSKEDFMPLEALRASYYQVLYAAGEITYFVAKGYWFPMTEWFFYERGGLAEMRIFLGLWWPFVLVVSCMSVIFSLVAHVFSFRSALRKKPLPLLVALNIPLLFLDTLMSRKAFFPHYTISLFPLALLAVAEFGSCAMERGKALLFLLALTTCFYHGVVTARIYEQHEAPVSYTVLKEMANVVAQDAEGSAVRLEFRIPWTRIESYELKILAREIFGQKINEDSKSRITYALVPPYDKLANSATKVWDLGYAWLVKMIR